MPWHLFNPQEFLDVENFMGKESKYKLEQFKNFEHILSEE